MNFIAVGNYRRQLRMSLAILLSSLPALVGCESVANYRAETMPNSLRIAAAVNPQEVDLSRLASTGTSSATIGVGDVLDITIAAALTADATHTWPAQVNENGSIELSNVGAIPVAGLEPDGASAAIRAAVVQAGLYQAPQVTVLMKSQRQNYVRVIGAVKEPGLYPLPPGRSDLLSAIVAAGGLAEDAGAEVEIRNPTVGATVAGSPNGMIHQTSFGHSTSPQSGGQLNSRSVNLVTAAKNGTGGYEVLDGGVVMVKKDDPAPISVIGLVSKPGEYDFPVGRDLRVLGALSMAGGRSNNLADKIYIIRPLAGQVNPAVIRVSLRQAKKSGRSNERLAPGDTISVEASPATVVMDALQIIRFGVNGSLSTLF
jgi:polysaccharide export outer membrane protein